ncbi:hypothetical protein TEA_000627 [Camellia sinensis var. sinensis]|uniref:Uncharacterized protein n=1 Tax=Camellia sinensis var. sinensis TaxID=542762 RepID=A0A4S4EUC8_CAMSN|nr:hypothetical protein TEA_000627 [Camellia sinensis var. sinensis]
MVFLKTLRSRHFHTLLNPQNPPPSQYFKNPTTQFFHRSISLSAQFKSESISNQQTKKPLHVLFKEAVGLCEKIKPIEAQNEPETNELKNRLRKLEEEVRRLKENSSEKVKVENLKKKKIENDESSSKSLYALFANKGGDSEKPRVVESLRMEDPIVYKELLLELALFVKHLYKEGCSVMLISCPITSLILLVSRTAMAVILLEGITCSSVRRNVDTNELSKIEYEKSSKDMSDLTVSENPHNRQAHSFKSYELKLWMHRWLSASDLKKVALFGCPSLGRKNVFSAKSLRNFFRIQGDTVCSKCVLKSSCKFVNQSVSKGNNNNLNLAVVMRVIILYTMESVPPPLVVPDEIEASVNVLLKEVLNYCQYSNAQIWEMKCDDQMSTLLIAHAENNAKDCCYITSSGGGCYITSMNDIPGFACQKYAKRGFSVELWKCHLELAG